MKKTDRINTQHIASKPRPVELEENLLYTCRSLLYFLEKYEESYKKDHDKIHIEKYKLLLKDLIWKISRLNQSDKLEILLKTWFFLLPREIRNIFSREELGILNIDNLIDNKFKRDIVIITARGDELKAVLFALGHPGPDKPDAYSTILKLPLYSANLTNNQGDQISLLVTMAGEERNISVAIAIMDILYNYSIELLIMIGITAGRTSHSKRGDVIFPFQVYDYEGGRLIKDENKETVLKPKPDLPKIKKPLRTAWEIFNNTSTNQFIDFAKGLKQKCNPTILPDEVLKRGYKPKIIKGDITSGEKLAKDGEYIDILSNYNDSILGLNEEDYGFSKTADDTGIQWCIFRGVSDHGNPESNSIWQFISSLNAAAACVTFLKAEWPLESV